MVTLTATARETFGKRLAAARAEGLLPVVIYGRKQEATSLFVNTKEFKKAWKEAGESTVVQLEAPDAEHDVIIHDVAWDPVTGEPIHVDLYAVEKDKPIEVDVELVFEGVAPAVKDLGGTLVKVLHELTIKALPRNLPHNLIVDISKLETLESQILVKDVVLPTGVSVLNDPEEVVAAVTAVQAEPEEPAAETMTIADIEVEKKGKQEEEGETAAA